MGRLLIGVLCRSATKRGEKVESSCWNVSAVGADEGHAA